MQPTFLLRVVAPILFTLAGCAGLPQPTPPGDTPSWIDAGPMIGHVSDHDAAIWLRTRDGTTPIADATQQGRPLPVTLEDRGDGCFVAHVAGLVASERVNVRVHTDQEDEDEDKDASSESPSVELSFPAAPTPSSTGTLRIAFGSCLKESEFPTAPILSGMLASDADINLFVGDNTYYVRGATDPDRPFSTTGPLGEWSSKEGMLSRQLNARRLEEMRPLVRSRPNYAVWDDHDFGPNNSDSTFAGRDTSLAVFKQVWANPGYGTDQVAGIFSTFRRGPVQIFLMDNRYHRSSQETPDEVAEIWGSGQVDWFLDQVAASDAPVKVIVNGTQFIHKGKPDDSHWHFARREYYRVIEGLHARRADGVIFLTGDRHYSELMRLSLPDQPDLYEFTSSPIQQGRIVGARHDDHPTRLFATDGNSFGVVTIDVRSAGVGTVTFECRNEENQTMSVNGHEMSRVVDLSDLTYRRHQEGQM